jgi:hypothetical protein
VSSLLPAGVTVTISIILSDLGSKFLDCGIDDLGGEDERLNPNIPLDRGDVEIGRDIFGDDAAFL